MKAVSLRQESLELLHSMCLDRQLVIYPEIHANDSPLEIQDKIVREFESKVPPVHLSN